MKGYIRFSVFVSIIAFYSCVKPSVDITPPTINVQDHTPDPVEDDICGTLDPNVFILEGGDQLSFDAIFEDNDALSQYKIDIHNNFDCHGHGGGSAPSIATPNVDNVTTDWSVLDIKNISGTSASILHTLDVPENVTAGNYHYHIQVIDESGNDNPFTNFFSLKITNPRDKQSPEINIQEPSASNFEAKKGESVRFTGEVSDDVSLSEGGNGVLYLAYTDLSSGNTFATNQVFVFDETVDKNFEFDFEYIIPQTLVAGDYRFSLGANDGVRNVAPFVFFEVAVKN